MCTKPLLCARLYAQYRKMNKTPSLPSKILQPSKRDLHRNKLSFGTIRTVMGICTKHSSDKKETTQGIRERPRQMLKE